MVLLYLKEFDSNLEVLIWNIKPQHSEIIQNNLNPDFEKYFVINYEFCKKLELKFVVVDVHGYYDQDYEHYSILGSVECLLEDIICEHDTKTLNLVNENLQKNSSFLRVTPVYRTEDVVVTLSFSAKFEKQLFNKMCSFFTIHKSNIQNKNFEVLYKSEIILKNFEPHFQNLVVNLNKIINECDLNDDCLLKFEVFNAKKKFGEVDEFVGSFQTTLSELRGEIGNNLDFELINERKKSAKSGQKSGILPTYKNSGFFKVSCLKYEKSCSFLDYMAGGLKFAVGFAIDTSFSTNCYDLVSSCIASFGSLLENYTRSSTKLIDLIGFDTSNTKYIAGDKYTFDLNDGIEEHTTIGHEKALETYGTLIRKNDEIEFESLISNNSSTKLPSKDKTILACQKNIALGTIINEIVESIKVKMEANVQTYSVYTIFTESDSIDFENTIRALLATDKIPLSLFIIGLGDIKYTNLQKVFSDNGLYGRCVFPRSWENVKFVRYSDYEDVFDIENLLLSFLPEQVLEYMKNNNISPLVRKRKNSTHVTNPASPNNTISRNSVSTNPSNTFNLKVVTEDQAMRRNSTISHQRRASVVAKSLQTATAASLPTVAGSHKQQSRNVSSPEEKIESNRRPSRNFGSERNSCIIDNSLSPCTPRKSFTAAISHRNSLIHQNYLDGVLLKLSTESLLKDNELCEKQEKRPTAVESASSIEDKTTYSSETVGKHVENLELKFDKFEENVQNDLSIILDLVRGLGASLVRIENRISQLENQAGQRYLEK